eukprot:scaffold229215_cov36-Prasinocladus_malaysianus.AAC.1
MAVWGRRFSPINGTPIDIDNYNYAIAHASAPALMRRYHAIESLDFRFEPLVANASTCSVTDGSGLYRPSVAFWYGPASSASIIARTSCSEDGVSSE